MKRYVLLILAIILFMVLRISWINAKLKTGLDEMRWQIDSLETEIKMSKIESGIEKNTNKINVLTLDSLNSDIKGHDSAIFSHGQQIRWLQWHVERLK